MNGHTCMHFGYKLNEIDAFNSSEIREGKLEGKRCDTLLLKFTINSDVHSSHYMQSFEELDPVVFYSCASALHVKI